MGDVHMVDARGLKCPQPVLEAKRVIDGRLADRFIVLVDNTTSRENVKRFVTNQGYEVETTEKASDHFELNVTRSGAAKPVEEQEELLACPVSESPATNGRLVVYVGSNVMGQGSDELGVKLMRGFLRTWIDVKPRPWRIVFINSGVQLTTNDEEAVDALSMLAEDGVDILSCGTCLEHFGIEDRLKIGRVTNMYEVIETLQEAGKVVSPD